MNNEQTLNEIITEHFDLSSYDASTKTQLVQESSQLVAENALSRALAESPQGIRELFDALMDTHPNPDDLMKFIQEHIPLYDGYVAQEIITLKNSHKAA